MKASPGRYLRGMRLLPVLLGKADGLTFWHQETKIDTAAIAGSWERYMIEEVNNPVSGIKKAIVVAGSDRRGTAYGLLSISKAIGVSPWYWWADAPIKQQNK